MEVEIGVWTGREYRLMCEEFLKGKMRSKFKLFDVKFGARTIMY